MEYQRYQLRDIGDIVSGATPKTTVAENFGGAIPWLTPADLSGYTQKYISRGKRNLTQLGYDSCSTQIMPSGTVLFSSRAPIGYTAIAKNPICTNQGFKSIVPKPFVNSEFLYYQLIYLRKTIQDMGSGTTFKEISAKKFGAVQVTIPPLVEQEHIISRIEELFSQLDVSVNELKTAKERLKVYRQAVLKEAFSKFDGSIEKTISSVCENIVDCPHSTPKWVQKGKLCLRTTNFKPGYLNLSEKNYVSEETFCERISRLAPKPGDVLFSREGAILGIACIIPDGLEVCMGQRMMLLRPSEDLLNKYLMYYLNSPKARTLIIENVGGTASPHINVGDIKNFTIPIIPFAQQQSVVAEIESRLSVCDNIEKTVGTALQQAEALRQSILKIAFEGGL